MKTRYLVTGGLGFIGSNLVKKLNGEITLISKTKKNIEFDKNNKIKIVIKDINKINKNDLENIDTIYHLASTVDNYNVLTDPLIDFRTNVRGTIKILEACKNLQKKPKFIFLSTFFVYGNEYEKNGKPINEMSSSDPLSLYSISKLAAENIIKLYSKLYDIPHLIIRLTNVYGEKESSSSIKKAGFNYMLMKIVKNEDINLYNGGEFYRDYIHVDDVVSALKFLENKFSSDTFLVGSGRKMLFRDLILFAIKSSKSKSKIINIDPPRFNKIVGTSSFVADTRKIRGLGWKPSINYETGIRRVLEEYMKELDKI